MEMNELYRRTPTIESIPMSESIGRAVLLKMECYQPTGSFKIRGIGQLCRESVNSGISHLISSSGGNAGLAVAYAGRKLGAEVTVVVPATTQETVQQQIISEGAKVKIHGSVWDESHCFAQELTMKLKGTYVHPFDHPVIWQGHAKIIDEITEQCQKPDVVVLSVGGGGLLCGVAEGLHRNGWGDIPIVAVETEGADSLSASIKAGKLIELAQITSIASSLGSKRVAAKAFEWTQSHEIIPFTVTDFAAVEACRKFADDHRVLVEPACGATLSVVYNNSDIIESYNSILVVVCGGIGVSIEKLLHWCKK